MNVSFDFYEYAGVIVPGSVFAFCGMIMFPELQSYIGPQGVSVGELGLFVVLAYALGQLVQGIGNFIEWLWWLPWGGLPSNRVLRGASLTPEQYQRLLNNIETDGLDADFVSTKTTAAVVREIYVRIAMADRTLRIDKFNGIYGMLRGLSASLVSLILIAIIAGVNWQVTAFLACAAIIALRRMHRFGWHYAKELIVTYLAIGTDRNSSTQ